MAEQDFITDKEAARAMSMPAAIAAPRMDGASGYVADWVVDQLAELAGTLDKDVIVDTTIDPILQAEAEQALVSGLNESGAKLGVSQGAVVSIDPQGAVEGTRRRKILRAKPVQPRRRGEASAGLRVQAVRLSHRGRSGTDARQPRAGRADPHQELVAGKLRQEVSRNGHSHRSARNLAEQRRLSASQWMSGRTRSRRQRTAWA